MQIPALERRQLAAKVRDDASGVRFGRFTSGGSEFSYEFSD